jgi:peptide deformylase
MAVRTIVRLGHPALRTPARAVAPERIEETAFQRLVDDLVQMMQAQDGVGLAAPQLGVDQQLLVYGIPGEESGEEARIPMRVMINPMIEPEAGDLIQDWEECLSIPQLHGLVPRHPAVRVHALGRDGSPFELVAEGLEARIIQHEFDHLNGVVYLDRMRDLKSLAFGPEWAEYLAESKSHGSPPGG